MSHRFFGSHQTLKIGTRGSPLALAQAYETRMRLSNAFQLPLEAFEIIVIMTTGDRILNRPLKEIGGKGLFTREIEDALLNCEIDIAVHSMKDMPTLQPEGLCLDTYLPREDVRDAFVSFEFNTFSELVSGSVLGTSSLRRKAQLIHARPYVKTVEFRGNVQTRLKKLQDGIAQATLLAVSGLNRLNMDGVPFTPVEVDDMLPAIAQGAIGIERRVGDEDVGEMLSVIHDHDTGQRLSAERALLAALDGSCQTPIAGLAEIEGDDLVLRGQVLRPDGSESLSDQMRSHLSDGAKMGREMGKKLRAQAGEDFFDWLS